MNLELIKSIILQAIALVSVNALAFYYDGQWIQVAMAVDLLTLGYATKIQIVDRGKKDAKASP